MIRPFSAAASSPAIWRRAIRRSAGSRDEMSGRALAEAFATEGWQEVSRLHRDQEIPDERCWLRGPRWCLATS
jgi:protein-L-isoaspartate(D-aspartate) O-methyltransferase